jgi:hypothetical protein
VPVRYTVKEGALYVTALEWPGVRQVVCTELSLPKTADLWYPFTATVKVTNPASTTG